jgi:hypothetical protein
LCRHAVWAARNSSILLIFTLVGNVQAPSIIDAAATARNGPLK